MYSKNIISLGRCLSEALCHLTDSCMFITYHLMEKGDTQVPIFPVKFKHSCCSSTFTTIG